MAKLEMQLDITVIILTYNEEIHIQRCIQNAKTFAKQVVVVDSYSNDNTVALAERLGARVYYHAWENNYAKQFNWALDNVPIDTDWVLRLDADEYLLPELVEEMEDKLDKLPRDITGIIFKRRTIFLGKWIKHGEYPAKLLRLFKYRKAKCEERWMDEHIEVSEGKIVEFVNDFVDENMKSLDFLMQKHISYSVREAIDLIGISNKNDVSNNLNPSIGSQAYRKRMKKIGYSKLPLFWRAFGYFVYRYILKLGFLDGIEGFLWTFIQGLWYRMIVDAKVYEIRSKGLEHDYQGLKRFLADEYNINLDLSN